MSACSWQDNKKQMHKLVYLICYGGNLVPAQLKSIIIHYSVILFYLKILFKKKNNTYFLIKTSKKNTSEGAVKS